MRVADLRIEGFRGIRSGSFSLGQHCAIVGPNGSGKSTIIDALSLALGRTRMIRTLTEHDFTGSDPRPADRLRVIATLTGFGSSDPDEHTDWFRMGRAVPKWLDSSGKLHTSAEAGRALAAQIGCIARFDHSDLAVEVKRYFHDDDAVTDPFLEDGAVEQIPTRLLDEVGYYVLPARRSWEGVTSFNSELFRRTVSNAAGIPAGEILAQRDQLRNPEKPLEASPALTELVSRLDESLARLVPGELHFRLRVTSGDCEGVLQALLPHYANKGTCLPASRHGMGLLSLQSLLLLLEMGRARKKNGLSFILALEEPELHLAPGLQARLVAEAIALADQTVCTTHSPRVTAMYDPTSTRIMTLAKGVAASEPFLDKPLAAGATNDERKLYSQNRVRVVEALMSPYVLVPEGRFDAEWLRRLSEMGERQQKSTPPFSTMFGVVPTENAAVVFTSDRLVKLRREIVCLVDGDKPGDGYAEKLSGLTSPPQAVCQWPTGWTIEDVVAWIIAPVETKIIPEIASALPTWGVASLTGLTALLKTPNDKRQGQFGIKEDLVAHDAIVTVIREHKECVARAAEVCEAFVHIALGVESVRMKLASKPGELARYRFVES